MIMRLNRRMDQMIRDFELIRNLLYQNNIVCNSSFEKIEVICNNRIMLPKVRPTGRLYRKKDAFENMENIAKQNLYEFNAK